MRLRREVQKYKGVASKSRSTWDKLRKERDHHRMHHSRILEEKKRLMGDLKRLKEHYEHYEPALEQVPPFGACCVLCCARVLRVCCVRVLRSCCAVLCCACVAHVLRMCCACVVPCSGFWRLPWYNTGIHHALSLPRSARSPN